MPYLHTFLPVFTCDFLLDNWVVNSNQVNYDKIQVNIHSERNLTQTHYIDVGKCTPLEVSIGENTQEVPPL